MNVLSLFDGISCGMVAFERTGIIVDKYDAYEIDPNAIKVSSANYPQITHKGNVFKAEYSPGVYDILIGGSPCTYWSVARAGRGDRETASSGIGWELFKQYIRALNETGVKYFLYENNKSMSDDIKDEITKALGVDPVMIDSADFSAQIRKRYYWTNIPIPECKRKCDLVIRDIVYDHDYEIRDFAEYADTVRTPAPGGSVKWDPSGKGYYSQQYRARGLDVKMHTVPAAGADKCNIWLGGTQYRRLHPVEAERLQTLPDNYTAALASDRARIKAVGNGWTVDVIAWILSHIPREEDDEWLN